MSLHDRGVYITLLAAAWESSDPGTLPLPIKATAKAAYLDVRTVKCFLRKWASLKSQDRREIAEKSPRDRADVSAISRRCFVEIDGKLVNEKLHDQWIERCQFHENAQGRGRKGAEARWGKKDALSNQESMLGDASSSAPPLTPSEVRMTHHQSLAPAKPLEKPEGTADPPQELYRRLENWEVTFDDQAARKLWKVCQRELPALTVPMLMSELERAWSGAVKKKINEPVGFLIDACRGACRHQWLYPDEKPRDR